MRIRSSLALATLSLLFVSACPHHAAENAGPPQPPRAERVPHAYIYHGEQVPDHYYWLRKRGDKRVIAYLEAENAYTTAMMKHTEPLQKALYDEMLSRIQETDESVPYPKGDYFYYSRTEEGKDYPIYCRKKGSLDAPEQILLDLNTLAKDQKYLAIGSMAVSPNQQLLAYSLDFTGGEKFALHVKDLATGKVLDDHVDGTYYGIAWANDNKTLYYTIPDSALRPYEARLHVLGTDTAKDQTVYTEKDEKFHLSVSKSKTEKYIFVTLQSSVTTEVRYLDADKGGTSASILEPRRQSIEYDVEHQGDRFLILTNDDAQNFRLMEAPVRTPGRAHWKEVIPASDAVLLESMEVFKDWIVVRARQDAVPGLRVIHVPTGDTHTIEFPEPVYTSWIGVNEQYDTSTLRLTYTSFVTPVSTFDYDMKTRKRELKKEQPVLGGYDRTQYVSERTYATAADGKRVPVSIVYKKGLQKNGKNPCYLRGYGAYGISSDVTFSSVRLSLLDRGFVYAIAHVRGGSELGRQWYEDGKFLHKKNTFTDFIAVAEHLISSGYTSKELLAASGGSAGGMLMGAIANMRPDLFQVVVANVPFVDVVNTMMDESIPLTVIEYEEWGNPHDKTYYDYMRSYAPYDNVVAQDYPNMLITAGLNDPRVQYWEPAKWTAKLRHLKTDHNVLLLKTNMGAGHGGASGRYEYLKEIALEYAFILDRLNVAAKPGS